MRIPSFVVPACALVALSIYLFVSAPPALPDVGDAGQAGSAAKIPIEFVLETVASENEIVRALYTSEIVGKKATSGLAFDERWRDEDLEAGPLPALFLRGAARSLERNPIPLGLFLGSDFPIASSNRFEGLQVEHFEAIKKTKKPSFFFDPATNRHTAMFADIASVQGCVTCHNEHPESPKTDWVLNDIMGATTWTYPKAFVSQTEYLEIIAAVRQSFRDSYNEYLIKAATFREPPMIGAKWPAEGRFLPSLDVFMAEFARRASATTVERLLTMPVASKD